MGEELVLFDIPGKQGRSWSPNVWKVRAVLNYMKIPYRTEWIEFPDIEPRMKELQVYSRKIGSMITDVGQQRHTTKPTRRIRTLHSSSSQIS